MKKLFVILCLVVLFSPVFGQEQQQQDFAYLSSVKGDVFLGEEPANQDLCLMKGDWLLTKKGGRAEVCFGTNGFLTLDENTKVNFVELSPEESVVVGFEGAVYLRNLKNVEFRASGEPKGKIIFAEENKIVRVDMDKGKVRVYEGPGIRDSNGFDSWNYAQQKVQEPKAENQKDVTRGNYYNPRRYWPCLYVWYVAYPWYPMYYHFYNYGYYYSLYYGYNNYGRDNYGYNNQNYSNQTYHSRISSSQLSRRIHTFTSRPSGSTSSFSSAKTFGSTYASQPSRIISKKSSYRSSSSSPKTVSRSSSSSTSRSVSRGSLRKN